jgi:hypothetical protein
MKKLLPLALLFAGLLAHAQEGPLPTQALITIDSKDAPKLVASDLTVSVDGRKVPLTGLSQVLPSETQVALLIDDGLRTSVGRELDNLRAFITSLPAGTEIFIGYMSSGGVQQVTYFTADHAAAASKLRLPIGVPGVSASPYFCLSQFVKEWPIEGFDRGPTAARKARFVIMMTNGVDPYNGSTRLANQNSPYVETAQRDAQRAGVSVSSIYYGGAGIGGASANFSGQSYLVQVGEATGGRSFYNMSGNPVSIAPYLQQFQESLAQTYRATFDAEGKDLVTLRVKSNVKHVKLRAPQQVLPGNSTGGPAH